jgi:hypothetical protein
VGQLFVASNKGEAKLVMVDLFESNVVNFLLQHFVISDEINIGKYFKIHDITKPWIQD